MSQTFGRSTEILAAVERILVDSKYQDVVFKCKDGNVSSNRAYLAARCDYFDRLLYGSFGEGGSSEIYLPQASVSALRHVIEYLHTGKLPGPEIDWMVLLETCSLAQQYMLPEVVNHVAACLCPVLQPADLGPALSFALQEDLTPVIKNIWLAVPALLPRPVSFTTGFSPAAINFCLQHICFAGLSNLGRPGSIGMNPVLSCTVSSSKATEQELLHAVLAWAKSTMHSCEDCSSRQANGKSLKPGSNDSACDSQPAMDQYDSSLGTSHCETPIPSANLDAACCERHQKILQGFLVALNWQHLDPSSNELLEKDHLLSPVALLEVYKAHHRAMYKTLNGWFNQSTLCDGVRYHLKQGQEVIECSCIPHMTISTCEPLVGGKHCWEVTVQVACDLVWIGVGDGTLEPAIWGGKQAGGWFYGSNDALCHNSQSDKHAYTHLCGHGKWGEGAVITCFADLEARQMWIAVNGSEPKLAFSDLPEAIYPAVSIRAPAQLAFRFRNSSWAQ
eukprot:jgi/Chrzof1/3922/Cz13g13150.t1